MKKVLCLLLAVLLVLGSLNALGEEDSVFFDDDGEFFADDGEFAEDDGDLFDDEPLDIELVPYDYNDITVGNPTPLNGQFFTDLWGNATSDTDVRHLVAGYNLVTWDSEISLFRFDHTVVNGVAVTEDQDGNRHYLISLYSDLYFSDGTPINAWNYAFSVLLQCSPLINELGGHAAAFDYLIGFEEYANGTAPYLYGVHVPSDNMLLFSVKKEALPYFYELSRLAFYPYPIHAIAPGCAVYDDGNGVYIGNANLEQEEPAFTADLLKTTILAPETGYLVHPNPGSGPYSILSYDGTNAVFEINPYYKGNEEGVKPRIKRLTYHGADNETMIQELGEGKYALLNKVAMDDTIIEGLQLCIANPQYTRSTYPRVGLTYVYFNPDSGLVQTQAVRQAISYCLETPQYIAEYVGQFGLQMPCMVGMGQWMYGLLTGTIAYPVTMPANATQKDEEEYEKQVKEWEALSFDGMKQYDLDLEEAARLLNEDGWTLNEQGGDFDPEKDQLRCKMIDGTLCKLEMTMGYPEEPGVEESFTVNLIDHLSQIGVQVTLVPLAIDSLAEAHNDHLFDGLDLVYLGDNFNISFDPALFFWNDEETAEELLQEDTLPAAYRELYELALDMDRTEPKELLEYMRKWLVFQERLMELVPVIPVYSNVYFDFFTKELDNYWIEEYVTWADAIVPARMRSILVFDEDTVKLEADLSYADGSSEVDFNALLERQEHEKTDYNLGALARFPQEVRDQVPPEFTVIYEFVSSTLNETPEEDAESIAVIFNFQTPYQEDEPLYLIFGIPGKGSDVEWFVKEGLGLKDGSVSVFLTMEEFNKLSGKLFALAVVSQ